VQFFISKASFSVGYQPQNLGDMQDLEEVQFMKMALQKENAEKGTAERKSYKAGISQVVFLLCFLHFLDI